MHRQRALGNYCKQIVNEAVMFCFYCGSKTSSDPMFWDSLLGDRQCRVSPISYTLKIRYPSLQ